MPGPLFAIYFNLLVILLHDVKNNVLASAKMNKSLLPIATWSLLNALIGHLRYSDLSTTCLSHANSLNNIPEVVNNNCSKLHRHIIGPGNQLMEPVCATLHYVPVMAMSLLSP